MKSTTTSTVLLGALLATTSFVEGLPKQIEELQKRYVYTNYNYTGPAVPIADWVDQQINGDGTGFIRLVEKPAVSPAKKNPTNNINVISRSYVPGGMNIHFQTPFGLGAAPSLMYGVDRTNLKTLVTGATTTYDRTPPCSLALVTMCSQFFHDIQITGLKADSTYYYQIQAANGTTESDIMSFITSRAAGKAGEFTVAVLNDMGYTNAAGTHQMLTQAAESGAAFAWHGGDISYADDWFDGILACATGNVCSNGTNTKLPPGDEPPAYKKPLPAGEVPNQGGPYGGDASPLYETNWDIWQQWMNSVTTKIPYMVNPGNHEAACAEFDNANHILATYLNENKTNSSSTTERLSYYSCPPSQRNFTAYQNRFRMPGKEVGGVSNFWYSFDYGLAHFVSFDGETDYAYSPEWPFQRDLASYNSTAALPLESQTYETDSGPFGAIDGGIANVYDTKSYEQYQWLANDLANVDRTKTPWVIAMSHRPMYSSQVSTYQKNMRNAFEELFISNGVDLYLAGHIHWYERTWPMMPNGTLDTSSIVDRNTYYTNPNVSMTHIVNGMAGNIESHSTLSTPVLPLTNFLDKTHYGFSTMTVHNKSALTWNYIHGDGTGVGDSFTLLKRK